MAWSSNVVAPDPGLGAELRVLRKALGLSQQEFGKEIGFSPKTIGLVETGRNRLTKSMLKEIQRRWNSEAAQLVNKASATPRDVGLEREDIRPIHWLYVSAVFEFGCGQRPSTVREHWIGEALKDNAEWAPVFWQQNDPVGGGRLWDLSVTYGGTVHPPHKRGGGWVVARLVMPAPLVRGEYCLVTVEKSFVGEANRCPPYWYMCMETPPGLAHYALAVRFHRDDLPGRVWWFERTGLNKLPSAFGSSKELNLSDDNSVEKHFVEVPANGKAYGIAWEWSRP